MRLLETTVADKPVGAVGGPVSGVDWSATVSTSCGLTATSASRESYAAPSPEGESTRKLTAPSPGTDCGLRATSCVLPPWTAPIEAATAPPGGALDHVTALSVHVPAVVRMSPPRS